MKFGFMAREKLQPVPVDVARHIAAQAHKVLLRSGQTRRHQLTKLLTGLEELAFDTSLAHIHDLGGMRWSVKTFETRCNELNRPLLKAAEELSLGSVMLCVTGTSSNDLEKTRVRLHYAVPNKSPPPEAPDSKSGKSSTSLRINNAPALHHPFVGRTAVISDIFERLNAHKSKPIAIHGWPGVGKTTLGKVIARHTQINEHFPHGVLWASIGPKGDPLPGINEWGRLLGERFLTVQCDINGAKQILLERLRDTQVLLIVDDLWDAAHFTAFDVAGPACGVILTTRNRAVALEIAKSQDRLIRLDVLTQEESLDVLKSICPQVVQSYESACCTLIEKMDGLPLALQVVGRLLQEELMNGLDVQTRIEDLTDNVDRVLAEKAPRDMLSVNDDMTPTVRAILQRSVDHLPVLARDRFILLGTFAPQPATFNLAAVQAVWETPTPHDTIRLLINRGLLEPLGKKRFQMHPILVHLARSLG